MLGSASGRTGQRAQRRLRAAAAVAIGAAVLLLGVFLADQGLDRADKWASVLGLFLNVAGATAAVSGLWLALQTRAAMHADFVSGLDAEPLLSGDPRRVGGFRLLGRVGIGAMGQVYLGQAPDGTVAAVKVMRSDLAGDPVFRQRFEHELRDIERVQGPRFPSLLRADTNAERPWLATEYHLGLTLDEAVAAGGPWNLPAIGWLAAGIAEALAAIHTGGIVHRDLKPSNILIDEDGPQLIDFGIARFVDDTRLTNTGAVVGTFAFMSPEQARAERNIGPPADVFALGAVLAFVATGQPPFGEGTGDEVLIRIRSRRPELGELAGRRDPVAGLVRACLQKEPGRRPSLDQIIATCRPYRDRAVAELLPDELRSRIAARRAFLDAADDHPADSADQGLRRRLRWPGSRRPPGRTTQAVVAAGLVVSVAVGSWLLWWPRDWESALAPCAGPDTVLRIASSADKDDLLRDVAAGYGPRSAEGRCVQVVVDEANSGKTMNALARGWPAEDGRRPDVWSPASVEWLALAHHRAAGSAAAAVFPQSAEPIMTTPLVIAMLEPMARALGWPDKKDIGLRDLAELATDENGWSRHGHPEWGQFRLGKTNPNYSTSGLNATIGAFRASLDEPSNDQLTEAEIADEDSKAFVSNIEKSIVHYGETSLHFLTNLRRADDENRALSYISAVAIEESSMLAYNAGYPDGTSSSTKTTKPTTKLVAIHPTEGTLDSDHPYIELDWPDTEPAKHEVARDFFGHLRSRPVQERFQEFGFRDHLGRAGLLATLDNGVDPDATITRFLVPDGPVLDKALSTWAEVRKPARVLLAIDTSDSMNEGVTHEDPAQQDCSAEQRGIFGGGCPTKIELVKHAKNAIVSGFTGDDSAGLWKFSENVDGDRDFTEVAGVERLDERGKQTLLAAIDGLTTNSTTALYDTIAAAVETMAADHAEDTINAVVVLTDGKDTSSQLQLDALLARLEAQAQDKPVRVFTIAYGFGSDEDSHGRSVLEQIAEATGAAKYDAKDPYSVTEDLVAAVISNF